MRKRGQNIDCHTLLDSWKHS